MTGYDCNNDQSETLVFVTKYNVMFSKYIAGDCAILIFGNKVNSFYLLGVNYQKEVKTISKIKYFTKYAEQMRIK